MIIVSGRLSASMVCWFIRRLPMRFQIQRMVLRIITSSDSGIDFNPLTDFCRRFAHRTTQIDRRVYIDGGYVDYGGGVYPDSTNYTNSYLLYLDLDEISQIELGSKTTPSSTFVVRSESIPAMTQGLDSNFNAPPAIISHPEPPAPTSIMDALRAQRAGPPDSSHHVAMHNIS